MNSRPVVIATDFSHTAQEGLRWGCNLLASGFGGVSSRLEGRLLHVVLTADANALYPLFDLIDDGEGLRRQIAEHAENALDRLMVAVQQQGLDERVILTADVHHAASVAEGILEYANAVDASLVVLGTHGRGGFKRWLLGSVTEEVLRRARCAVLCCPPGKAEGGGEVKDVRRILAAVDLSDVSPAVIEGGCLLAEALGASLDVAHVIPESSSSQSSIAAYLRSQERLRPLVPELRERARDELLDLGSRRNLRRYGVRYRVAAGRPASTLLEMAASSRAGLIVIASRTSSLEKHCLGSVTHALLRQSTCPVLVVPPCTETMSSGDDRQRLRAIV